jgi:hypothetical protein
MAFASVIKKRAVAGSVKIVCGTFDAVDTITGNIDTGMTYLYSLQLQNYKAAPAAAASGLHYEETIPGPCGRAVTIHCGLAASGIFTAIGKP